MEFSSQVGTITLMRDKELEKTVEEIAERLAKERKRQELTFEDVATKAGLHRSTISLIESKKRIPTILVFLKLCKALGISPKKLLG